MATGIRLEMNYPGMIAVMQSAPVMARLQSMGEAVAASASASGGQFEMSSRVGRTRARVSVITADYAAREAEAIDRVLTRAMEAARGA